MAIPILNHLDFQKSAEIQNVLLHTEASGNITSPGTGQIIYDSGTVKYYNGSSWVSIGTSSGSMSQFILEDDDGTEVSISNNEEVKFIGSGITTNWTDTDNGTDGDPFDLTFTVDAAQTGITSVYNASLAIGYGASHANIDFSTDNAIIFDIDGTQQIKLQDGALVPITDNDIDLGTSSLEFKDAFFDGTVTSDAFAGPLTGDVTGNADTATTATNVTVSANNTTDETTYLTFVDGATGTQGIETDTGLTYNPSTGILKIEGTGPSLYLDDSDTTTDGSYLTGSSSAASLALSADYSNNLNTTKIYFSVDGKEVGHFRGDSSQIGSLRMFPEKNDNASQGIFFGTASSGSGPGLGDFSDTRVISMSSSEELFLMPGSNTTLATVPFGITSSAMTTNVDTINFNSANSADPLVIIKNTTNDANGARLRFVKDKGAAGADGDDIGIIEFVGDDAAQTQTTFAKVLVEVGEADDTDEAGKLSLQVASSDGTTTGLTDGLILTGHKTSDYVDVTIGGGSSSTVTVSGNLQVSGTTTTVNSTTVNLNDHNIVLDSGNSTSAVVNGAGITIEGGSGDDATFTYNTTGPKFELKLGSSYEDLKVDGLIAASLDISGNADIDGTMEADAYTVDGTALSEYIADTAGAMTTGNTETGISVTYQDADNTIDFEIAAAQTGITSLLATDIKIGEDDQTKIDFETADEIHFYAANVEQVYLGDNIFGPQSDSDVDLGSSSVRWKDAYVDSITVTGEVDAVTLDISGNADIDGTLETDALTIDGTAIVAQATASAVGGVELATAAEVIAGTDTARVPTVDTLAAKSVVATIATASLDSTELSAVINHALGTTNLLVTATLKNEDSTTDYGNCIIDWECTSDGSSDSTNHIYVKFAAAPPSDVVVNISSIAGATAVTPSYPS